MLERKLIEQIRTLTSAHPPAWLKCGIGDDAAVVELTSGSNLVLTVDMVVEGTHFAEGTQPQQIGYKAVARALSDLAAAAARPLCLLAAVNFGRRRERDFCSRLCAALVEAGQRFSAPLVGGDIASGESNLTVTVTAIGTPGPAGAIGRGGALPGDAVCVTGGFGGSMLGKHLNFSPRILEALELVKQARIHALIDVSDGLSTDLLHIAEASGRGLVIELEKIPLTDDSRTLAERTGRNAVWHALNDGEDYELAFCTTQADAETVAREGVLGVPVTAIGNVTAEKDSYTISFDGKRETLVGGGWEHLGR